MKSFLTLAIGLIVTLAAGAASAGDFVFSRSACLNGSCGSGVNVQVGSGFQTFSVPTAIVTQTPQIVLQQHAPPVIIRQQPQIRVNGGSCGSSGVNVNVNSGSFRPFGFLNVRRGLFGRTVIRGRF